MIPQALRIIQEEHQALSAMLLSLSMLVRRARQDRQPPPFDVLRAMLFYVDEFPEKRHHRKESELLFPKLRARTPQHRDVLDRLDLEHSRGELRIRELEHALLAYEVMGDSRRAAFEDAAARYIDFYLAHMALEEREVLPLAERTLTAADWSELNEAFAANRDALAGAEPETDYEKLFTRIVNLVPAPVGLGPEPRTAR